MILGTDESREKFSDSSVTDRRRFYSDTIDVKGESPTSSVKKRQSYKSYRIQLEELGSSESNSKENQSLSPSCNENSLCPLKIDVQCPESFDMVTFLNQITSTPAIELMQPPMLTPLLANTSPTPIDPSTPLSSLISSFQRKRSKSSSKDRPLSFGSLPPDYDEMSFVTTSAGSVPLQDYLKRNVPFSESMSSSSFPSCESDSAALYVMTYQSFLFDCSHYFLSVLSFSAQFFHFSCRKMFDDSQLVSTLLIEREISFFSSLSSFPIVSLFLKSNPTIVVVILNILCLNYIVFLFFYNYNIFFNDGCRSLPMSEAYAFDPRTPATSVSHIPVTSTMSTSVSVSSSISTPEGNEDALAASHLLDISSYPPSSQINSLDHPFASRSSNLKSSGDAEAESNTESLLLTKDVEK